MNTLLYFKASPRGARSHSLAVADAFAAAYAESHPQAKVEVRDLFEMDLPPFDGPIIQAKYNIMHGLEHTAEQREAWKAIETIIADFKSADRYLFAVPMWNFSMPYRLKHYLDLIAQPGYTFSAGPDGYKGLCSGKVFIAYARGGDYTEGTPAANVNFQSPYLEFELGFLGLSDIATVAVQPTLQSPETREASKAEAVRKAIAAARSF